jgi:hypothetical protein
MPYRTHRDIALILLYQPLCYPIPSRWRLGKSTHPSTQAATRPYLPHGTTERGQRFTETPRASQLSLVGRQNATSRLFFCTDPTLGVGDDGRLPFPPHHGRRS